MQCYIHQEAQAVGTCVGCGKFICADCCTEIGNKNYCKSCVNDLVESKTKQIDKLEDRQAGQPNVFMNAGGGGGGSSSSSSSSSAASAAAAPVQPRMNLRPRQSVGVHVFLALFTWGIGNIFYFLSVRSRQRQWDMSR